MVEKSKSYIISEVYPADSEHEELPGKNTVGGFIFYTFQARIITVSDEGDCWRITYYIEDKSNIGPREGFVYKDRDKEIENCGIRIHAEVFRNYIEDV